MVFKLLVVIGLFGGLQLQAKVYERVVLSDACTYAAPLTTYQRCDESSYGGRWAENCAIQRTLRTCRTLGYIDCHSVGVEFVDVLSKEFVGYRACQANAFIVGYNSN